MESLGELSSKKRKRLEAIASGVNNSHGLLKKVVWTVPAIYVLGTMPHESQAGFCNKTGYGTPRLWTSLNASLVGLVGMSAQTYFLLKAGEEGKESFKHVADWLHVTYNVVVAGYGFSFGALQGIIRLTYTNTNIFNRKGKGAWAIGFESAIWNSPYFFKWSYKKLKGAYKKLKKE